MSQRPILTHPNKELRISSQDVAIADIQSADMQKLVDDMIETMKKGNGVGLAAPQIGEHVRLIICETKRGPQAYFNPEIIRTSSRTVQSEEGCLSIPKVYGMVERHKSVKVEAYDRQGNHVTVKTGGLLAIIFQHEIDHLDGVLFIDRAHTVHDMTKEKEGAII